MKSVIRSSLQLAESLSRCVCICTASTGILTVETIWLLQSPVCASMLHVQRSLRLHCEEAKSPPLLLALWSITRSLALLLCLVFCDYTLCLAMESVCIAENAICCQASRCSGFLRHAVYILKPLLQYNRALHGLSLSLSDLFILLMGPKHTSALHTESTYVVFCTH